MIAVRDERPRNGEHLSGLLALYRDIVPVCRELRVTPLLTGSVAVFAYTRNRMMRVNDIDLACPSRRSRDSAAPWRREVWSPR